MATWSVLTCILKRLKTSQYVLESAISSRTVPGLVNSLANSPHNRHQHSHSHSDRNVNVVTLSHVGSMFSFNSRLVHTSNRLWGKKLPKGVPKKRAPLGNKKSTIKLERVPVFNGMTIVELAAAMKKRKDHVYEVLMFIPNTDEYDHDNAALDLKLITSIVKKSGMIPEFVSKKVKEEEKDEDVVRQPPPDPTTLVSRPPVVTIMGHVDHGKTTLLDQLRNSSIVDGEFGGITQHIGAFLVKLQSGESICFLDTPGHAAFSAMRSRGAKLTDIIVLVVAADDGVMQQTLESIHHAKEANVPLIVAINKIDKNNADVLRAKNMLLEHQVQLEEFGGEVQAVPISAVKGTNLLELQEAIVTQAELMNLKGDPKGLVEGRVVEARLDEKRGRLATAVIQRGTLKRGDCLVAGLAWAKVRGMFDDLGRPLQVAPPGTPVEIIGWKETPSAGDEILQVASESEIKRIIAWRNRQEMKRKQEGDSQVISEKREEYNQQYRSALLARREQGFYRAWRGPKPKESEASDESPQFSFVLKGDVDGSVEAILDTLDSYRSKMCQLDIIHYCVGNISESDVEMAALFDGEIYAFNVNVPDKVTAMAKSKNVPIRKHNIIYRLFEDLKEGLNSKLPLVQEDVVSGEAKVLQVFTVTLPNKKKTFVAGCRCTHGSISKKYGIKVIRENETVYKGNIQSLKHFKNEVDSVKKEMECGVSLDDSNFQFQPQDLIVCYEIKDIKQDIDWDVGF